MRTLHEVARQFPAAAEHGLTLDQVLDRRRQFGSNRLTAPPRQPAWKKFLARFNDPIIKNPAGRGGPVVSHCRLRTLPRTASLFARANDE
ncbi:MAG TPA: cation-transporting P-type ATPase [Gemmataceae bacterium]|jgi:hypothetical protein|nr:cation-transporting P-type ATPase [Gemmataceae bacterium]